MFDAFKEQKKYSYTLVPIFILKVATKTVARNNSDEISRVLPLQIHHNMKIFKEEVFEAKDPFFFIT